MFKKSLTIIIAICTIGAGLKAQCPAAGTLGGSNITVCLGSTATHAATLPSGFTGTWTKLNFWDQGTITTPSSPTTTVTNFNFTGTISEIWTITDGANCKNIKDTVTIVIQNAPTSANAGADKTICLGDAIILGATAAPAGSFGYWSILGGTNSSSAIVTDSFNRQSTLTGINSPGVDMLSWTVSNASCAVSFADTMKITTGTPPAPAIAGNDVVACVGDTITLYGSIPTTGNPVWSRAGVTGGNVNNVRFVPNANNDTVKVALNNAGTYTLYYTISVGTTNLNSPCTTQDTLVITVKPGLAVNAGPDQISCDGSTTTFTVLGNKPATGSGQWFIAGSIGSVTTTLDTVGTVTGLPQGISTLGWQVTDGVCTATDYMKIAVGPPSTAAIMNDSISGCIGDTLQLNGSVASVGIPSWSRVGVTFFNTNNLRFVPNANNDTVKIALNAAGTYKLYYTISLGSTGAAAACNSRDSVIVTIYPGPTVANISGPANLSACSTSTTFTLSANTPGAGETGAWSILNGSQGTLTPISATSTVVSGLPQGVTTVVWTITGVNGCVSHDKVRITIGASAGMDVTACVGDNAFQVSGSFAAGWTPLWSTQGSSSVAINGSASSANLSLSITTVGTTFMLYTIIDGNGCVSTDTMKITAQICIGTGIGDIQENEKATLLVYPNPTEGVFMISMKGTETNYSEIAIIALDGRTMVQEQLGSVKDIQKEIDLSNVAKGIYFVKVTKGGETTFTKLVVQ